MLPIQSAKVSEKGNRIIPRWQQISEKKECLSPQWELKPKHLTSSRPPLFLITPLPLKVIDVLFSLKFAAILE
jgi:hypothetical protein